MAKKNSNMPMPPPPPLKPSGFPEESRTDLDVLLGKRPAPSEPREISIPDTPRPAVSVRPKPVQKMAAEEEETSAPVFIKIDKYKDIIKSLQDLKSYSLGLRDALDAVGEMEKEIRNGLDISQKALDRFNQSIAVLDAKLLKLQGAPGPANVPEDVDEYIKNLYNQVEKLRHELRTAEAEL